MLVVLPLLETSRGAYASRLIVLRLHAVSSVEKRAHGVLAGGVVGGDVEQLFGGLWAFPLELMHQSLASGPRDERTDDLGVRYVWDGIALLGEASNVIAEGLSLEALCQQLLRSNEFPGCSY